MPDRQIRVTRPGAAERTIRKSELADHIASGWTPVWDQSVETLATQVGTLRDAVVDLAGGPVDQPAVTLDQVETLIEQRLNARLGSEPAPVEPTRKP